MRICCLTPLARRGPWAVPEYGAGSWCLALGGEFFPYAAEDLAPLEAYDLLLLHTSMALYPRILGVLERFAHKATVLHLTCDAMFIDPQGFFPGFGVPLKALLERARLAITETEEVGFFQAMTATPVVHLPLPVPLDAMRGLPSPDETGVRSAAFRPSHPASGERTPHGLKPALQTTVLLGSGLRPKKNGLATALAFRRLRERAEHPEARTLEGGTLGGLKGIVFAEEPEAERRAFELWGIEGVEVVPSCPQPDYWHQAAACGLALHLDYRRTIGRFSAECAALGVPCVSTAGATMQRALFPELIVEPWDVDGAASLAERLLREPVFRERVVARAAAAIQPYALEPMAARFREALARFAR